MSEARKEFTDLYYYSAWSTKSNLPNSGVLYLEEEQIITSSRKLTGTQAAYIKDLTLMILSRISGNVIDFLYRDYGHYIQESCLICFAQQSILDHA